MATITIGGSNGIAWNSNTLSKAAFAGKSENVTTVSSNVTLDACSFDNTDTTEPVFNDSKGALGFSGSDYTVSSNTQELTVEEGDVTVGLFGGNVVINSGVYVWSDSTSTPALKLNTPCGVVNNGYIIGKGGVGGYRANNAGDGGPALEIASGLSGVSVVNNSGAYIAGGGGGGAGSPDHSGNECGNGGGGAGGGRGGGYLSNRNGGSGGGVGSSGANGQTRVSSRDYGSGGQAGGGGGEGLNDGSGGGGGGRILPGTGGAGAGSGGGSGGGAGNAGQGARANAGGGGGGGWGASGGYADNSNNWGGGSGGAAIKDNGQTYTLTNNGTVYGTT